MFRPVLAMILLVVFGPTVAATDGGLGLGRGATSTGNVHVGLVVPDMVHISGLRDMSLQWSGSNTRFQASDGVCVYRNASGNYSVVASSNNGAGSAFLMTDGTSTVPYTVHWNGVVLNSGQRSTVFHTASRTALNCNGNPNVTLSVTASPAQVNQASRQGLHQDTLTVSVSAE